MIPTSQGCKTDVVFGERKCTQRRTLGFPAAEKQASLDEPNPSVRGSIDAKIELGLKGRRKLTRAPHMAVSVGPSEYVI